MTADEVENILLEFDPSLAPDLDESLCPYLGLNAFGEEKSRLFFGRQRLVADLLAHLQTEHLLVIVGSSGSGKSSIARAGLLPAMKNGGFPETEWTYLPPIVPGSDTLGNLNEALGDLKETNLVVLVDQFEEVFTLCLDEQNRLKFAQKLLELTRDPRFAHRVIL